MSDTYGMTLNSPMTREDWAKLTDANMEHTQSVTFQTEGGKEVEFVKVVHCKECKHFFAPCDNKHGSCDRTGVGCSAEEFCSGGERKDT